MKTRSYLLIFLVVLFFYSCDKGYDSEIFIDKYQVIYGKWDYDFTIGEVNLTYEEKPDHTFEFISYGKFRYNNEKVDKVTIVIQTETELQLNFSNFPNVESATIEFDGSDIMILSVVNGPLRFYSRKN